MVVSSVSHKHKSSTKTSRDLQPLASTDKADERIRLESRRKLEKFVEIERYLRAEVERRKARMFRQQRHHVKVGETCNCPHVLVILYGLLYCDFYASNDFIYLFMLRSK